MQHVPWTMSQNPGNPGWYPKSELVYGCEERTSMVIMIIVIITVIIYDNRG